MPRRCVTQHALCAPVVHADALASAGRPLIRPLARDFGNAASAGSSNPDGVSSDAISPLRAPEALRRVAARGAAQPARDVAASGASRAGAPRRRA